MQTKRYNISKPRKYTKDGVAKTYWDKVGEMVEFDYGDKVTRVIRIPAIGLEANVFEETPKVAAPTRAAVPGRPAPSTAEEMVEEEINPEDIPF